jgi:citrate/tricarballylate utilization protein
MSQLESLQSLTDQARALAQGPQGLTLGAPEAEVARIMQICNACRYCEGFCAVFPAMTRRLEFTAADTHYLANLCHNCGACLHACQYAPPNPFGVNVPQSLAQVRITTYERFAWPRALGTLYQRNGLTVAWALSLSLALFLIATMVVQGTWWQRIEGGNFYAIFPHGLLVWMFAPVFAWSVFALGVGVRDFWRAVLPMDGPTPAPIHSAASAEAAHDALRLKYLDGGHGLGCNESDDSTTLWRKRFHHATFYGFMLCFAATSVATLYHYAFGWVAPYPLTSLPVVLGTVGGIGLVIGPVGLLWLNLQRHPEHGDAAQKPMDRAFIALLFLCGSTGLALLALRETAALPLSLAIHLATVMAFFLTMPYGKFAHGIYRVAALLKFAIEKRLPNRLRLGSE